MNHGKRYNNNFKTIDRNLEYSLDDAVKAHNKMLNGKGLFGKILIKPNSD